MSTAIHSHTTIRVPADVVFRDVAGETVLMRRGDERWFALEGAAGPIWSLISDADGTTVGAVVERMLVDYDVDSVTLTNDVHRILGELQSRLLVRLA